MSESQAEYDVKAARAALEADRQVRVDAAAAEYDKFVDELQKRYDVKLRFDVVSVEIAPGVFGFTVRARIVSSNKD